MKNKEYLTEAEKKKITKDIAKLLKTPPSLKNAEPMDIYRWVASIVQKVKQVK